MWSCPHAIIEHLHDLVGEEIDHSSKPEEAFPANSPICPKLVTEIDNQGTKALNQPLDVTSLMEASSQFLASFTKVAIREPMFEARIPQQTLVELNHHPGKNGGKNICNYFSGMCHKRGPCRHNFSTLETNRQTFEGLRKHQHSLQTLGKVIILSLLM